MQVDGRVTYRERSIPMGHEHSHAHDHAHAHSHDQSHSHDRARLGGETPAVVDLSIPDSELSPAEVSRRGFLRGAGLLGVGTAAAAGAAFAAPEMAIADVPAPLGRSWEGHTRRSGVLWLAGDHHIHTRYSSDGQYQVIDQVRHANAYGLDWMVITDHGSVAHAKLGVDLVNPDIRAARSEVSDTLVFQGLEWNIPAAEHGTVFVHPGRDEVAVLKEFENTFDGAVRSATDSTAANEALALAGISFLASAVSSRRIADALMLANHPARKGIDSPHEIRNWRDAAPSIAVGFEGAPGHQGAGIPAPTGPGSARGGYENAPSAASFPAYPVESYRTWGGFDWMTATVGGLWDSLLAEGKPWWITANSDSHKVYDDISVSGGGDFDANGRYNNPTYGAGAVATANHDFWPGFYSRTHVGATDFSYAAVMAGLRAGRVWVDHGGLIGGLDVRVRSGGTSVTLGDTLVVRRGARVELIVTVDLAAGPNWAQFVPVLSRVDVIRGAVTGAAADRDTFTAPRTSVVKSYEVGAAAAGQVTLSYDLGPVEEGCYLRLRGTDGKRTAPGYRGAAVDPAGPAMDVPGSADPWMDLWFYTNPIWVIPR
jgi:PHP domain